MARHEYLIRLSYGFSSKKPQLYLNYWYDPPGHFRLQLGLDAVTGEEREEGARRDRFTFAARAGLSYPGAPGSQELFTGFFWEEKKPAALPGAGTEWAGLLYAGASELAVGGEGPAGYRRESELTAGFYFSEEERGFAGEGFWKSSRLRRGVARTTWKISLGLSQLPGYFSIGGPPGIGGRWTDLFTRTLRESYTVRGFAPGAVTGSGFLLLNAETYPLRIPVERGLLDWPVFFRQLRGGVFLDTGYAADSWEFTESGLLAAAGVELRLTMDFLYRPNALDFRIGVARPFVPRGHAGERAGGWRIYAGVSSEF